MNKAIIIGNLTADPQTATTQSGISLCRFTVAVNRRGKESQEDKTDFFRVTAWRELGDICARFLAKGRKVAVTGAVSASAYTGSDGQPRASLEVSAQDVEFLTPKQQEGQTAAPAQAPTQAEQGGFVQVDDEELPF